MIFLSPEILYVEEDSVVQSYLPGVFLLSAGWWGQSPYLLGILGRRVCKMGQDHSEGSKEDVSAHKLGLLGTSELHRGGWGVEDVG